ncbi:MAG: adenylate/guanylate cyclase domain-containing protein [Syntrophobacteraceae bacterium]
MATEGFKRKLTAIISADVVGYSRLMGGDESSTVKTLETYKKVVSDLIRQHRGRLVDSTGDNLLAEFVSVVDAVQCALAVQKEIQSRNAELPETRRMLFRIGINLGDVIEEEGRLYGDGVNIAARLESLAEPGGICVSKAAFEQIETKLPLGYEYMGEQSVKNIAKPVPAYKVVMDPRVTVRGQAGAKPKGGVRRRPVFAAFLGILVLAAGAAVSWHFARLSAPPPVEKASRQRMAFPLPDKPSIAVMPFLNMTGEQNQDFFCDGLSEGLITALSKMPQLFIIARDSTFVYKGKGVKATQVSEELGVQYVLDGSVQRAGDRVRVTAQLIDALNGHQLWSERYDRTIKDIFDLQDEITMKVITELRVKIRGGETERIFAKGTNNLQAYLKVLEGNWYGSQGNKEANMVAKRLYNEAIELDPNYVAPYFILANIYMIDLFLGASESPKETLSNGMKMAQKAVALDNSNASAQAALSYVLLMMRQHDKAIEAGERALKLDPNNPGAIFSLAMALNCSWRGEEALPLLRQSLRLNPFFIGTNHMFGAACSEAGKYEEGIAAFKRWLKIAPNDLITNVLLVTLYMKAGREDEAKAAAAEVQRIHPGFSLVNYAERAPMKEGPNREKWIDLMRRAEALK